MSSMVRSLLVFVLCIIMIGVSTNARHLRRIVDDKNPRDQRRRLLSIKRDKHHELPHPSIENNVTILSGDDGHNKAATTIANNQEQPMKTKFQATLTPGGRPLQMRRRKKAANCNELGKRQLITVASGGGAAAAAATTRSGKLPAVAKYSWRLPRKKRGVVPRMGFNLDYAPPRVHPPRHN